MAKELKTKPRSNKTGTTRKKKAKGDGAGNASTALTPESTAKSGQKKKSDSKETKKKQRELGNGNLVMWPKGVSGNPKGRPPNRLKHLITAEKISKDDVAAVLSALQLKTKAELEKIKDDPKEVLFSRACATALLKAAKSGNLKDSFLVTMEYMIGKPDQKINTPANSQVVIMINAPGGVNIDSDTNADTD